MRYTRLLVLFFIGQLFLSCALSSEDAAKEIAEKPFFDLNAFFSQEIQRLITKQIAIQKTITIDGASESKQIDSPDFEKDLEIFADIDINKIAWFEKYTIDSSFERNSLQKLSYTALDKELKTQSIQITFEKESPKEIRIQNQGNSPVAQAEQLLIYQPANGYVIQSKQKMSLAKEQDVKIEVEFEE